MASSAGVPTPQIDPGHSVPDAGGQGLPASKPHKSNLHHHDDIWNEEATFALLQAWGSKYVELNHGGLSRADWSHVTQQVVLHSGKTSLTDTQCRNRIDTLKKKYKREKHKLATMGGGSSSWVYFLPMDAIINPALKPSSQPTQPPTTTPMADHGRNTDACLEKDENAAHDAAKNTPLEGALVAMENHGHDAPNIVSASCEPPDESEMSQTSFNSSEHDRKDGHRAKRQKTDSAAFRVLAKALTKFADVYERIETAKLQHALDLEKTRMDVARNFELQKWQLLLQTQMELAKIKEGAEDVHSFVDDMSANLFAACFMPADYSLRSLP
ncbi:hypothetical protein GOP47_0025018 [Adiantum capillus-veneris]|uniref:Myb/SANT-like DNA-binding domain-containing protein n=1 Tax=Adiantum capillus-veneris TaxID=13818 RepID=A0A9D4U364_ADICA|nr:hypothetical protein GOP47_0025018 [Adiantum capillus-veneris]